MYGLKRYLYVLFFVMIFGAYGLAPLSAAQLGPLTSSEIAKGGHGKGGGHGGHHRGGHHGGHHHRGHHGGWSGHHGGDWGWGNSVYWGGVGLGLYNYATPNYYYYNYYPYDSYYYPYGTTYYYGY